MALICLKFVLCIMYMVVVLHVLGVGGILTTATGTTYGVAWFLETLAFCGVNCFALASGYVRRLQTEINYKPIILVWLQVVFLSSLITLAFRLTGNAVLDVYNIKKSILPLLSHNYWYVSAYFALFFFIPYINKMLATLSLKEMRTLVLSIVLLFSVFNNVSTLFGQFDPYKLGHGYSVLWIACLYVVGAWISADRMIHKIKTPVLLVGILLCSFSSWLDHMVGARFDLLNYTSPTILLLAICVLILFTRIRVRRNETQKLLVSMSTLSFGVYIVHCHWLVWTKLLTDRFALYASFSPIVMVLAVLATAAVIYLVCTLIDYVRKWVFSLVPKFALGSQQSKRYIRKEGVKVS